mmetsp:Transcript_86710/g.220893  ORF Transcript_86710/g.220893 Transcript_86710/m.220893 type:complete len:347 (+) Transcript_86710:502-1542(+)
MPARQREGPLADSKLEEARAALRDIQDFAAETRVRQPLEASLANLCGVPICVLGSGALVAKDDSDHLVPFATEAPIRCCERINAFAEPLMSLILTALGATTSLPHTVLDSEACVPGILVFLLASDGSPGAAADAVGSHHEVELEGRGLAIEAAGRTLAIGRKLDGVQAAAEANRAFRQRPHHGIEQSISHHGAARQLPVRQDDRVGERREFLGERLQIQLQQLRAIHRSAPDAPQRVSPGTQVHPQALQQRTTSMELNPPAHGGLQSGRPLEDCDVIQAGFLSQCQRCGQAAWAGTDDGNAGLPRGMADHFDSGASGPPSCSAVAIVLRAAPQQSSSGSSRSEERS